MTTLIGQPQYETSQPIYQNNNMPSKPTAAKILGKVGESLSWICCVHPPVERFSFVDDNANLGMVMRYKEIGSWEVGTLALTHARASWSRCWTWAWLPHASSMPTPASLSPTSALLPSTG